MTFPLSNEGIVLGLHVAWTMDCDGRIIAQVDHFVQGRCDTLPSFLEGAILVSSRRRLAVLDGGCG